MFKPLLPMDCRSVRGVMRKDSRRGFRKPWGCRSPMAAQSILEPRKQPDEPRSRRSANISLHARIDRSTVSSPRAVADGLANKDFPPPPRSPARTRGRSAGTRAQSSCGDPRIRPRDMAVRRTEYRPRLRAPARTASRLASRSVLHECLLTTSGSHIPSITSFPTNDRPSPRRSGHDAPCCSARQSATVRPCARRTRPRISGR